MENLTKIGLFSALAAIALFVPSCKKNNDVPVNDVADQPNSKLKVQSMDGNLISYWPLNWGPSGSGAITEDSGPGNHFLSFSAWNSATTDRYGTPNNAVLFPNNPYPNVGGFGMNDAVDLRLANTDFTINAWIKLDSYDAGNDTRIVEKRLPGNTGWGFSVTGSSFPAGAGRLLFGPAYSGPGMAYSTGTVSTGVWHMVSAVYILSSNEVDFYIDGVLSGSTTGIASPSAAANGSMGFGSDRTLASGGSFFYGAMDDIRIYKSALNAANIGVLYGQPDPNGILAYWHFDNNANDVSGNHFFGTANNTLAVADRFGVANFAYDFNGFSSYVTANDAQYSGLNLRLLNTDFTLNAWVKVNSYASSMQLIAKRSSTAGGWGWSITSSGYTFFGPGGLMTSSTGTTYVSPGSWHMLTLTYKYATGTVTHYVDGVAAGSYASGFPSPTSTTNGVAIGRDNLGANYFFNGSMDDVRIYKKVLSSTELSTLYSTQF